MIQMKRGRGYDKPFQLWADLQCAALWAGLIQDPIKLAAEEARRITKQQQLGIVPLRECRQIA